MVVVQEHTTIFAAIFTFKTEAEAREFMKEVDEDVYDAFYDGLQPAGAETVEEALTRLARMNDPIDFNSEDWAAIFDGFEEFHQRETQAL